MGGLPPEAERNAPAAFRNADVTPQAASTMPRPSTADLPRPHSSWWREYGNVELDSLEESALANNRELRVAIARVAQAKAQARLSEAQLFPNVDLFGRREAFGPEGGPGSVVEGEEWRGANRVRLGLRASYEADLWGKLGYAADSALALAAASVHHREGVALTLTSDVAAAYFEYLSYAARAESGERGVASRRLSLAAVQKRMTTGDATIVETTAQRAALSTAEAAASMHAQRRERAFNRLALLAGMSPADLKLTPPSQLQAIEPPPVNPGLPSELLCRRPDVRRAEAQLLAANFDVRSVRANMLPSFSLIGEIGMGARHLAALSGPGALFYLLTATLSQTLFDGGRKQAQLELSRARHLEMLEQYAGLLLTALREVEDALVARRLTAEQYAARLAALDAARASHSLQRRVFEAGGSEWLALHEAEQRLAAAEDAAEEALHDRMRASIDLYKALGGGSRGEEGRDPCVQ
jgi:NodT family efflux transporter outer membrane factor (OMF) lipoprotein